MTVINQFELEPWFQTRFPAFFFPQGRFSTGFSGLHLTIFTLKVCGFLPNPCKINIFGLKHCVSISCATDTKLTLHFFKFVS